MSAIGMSSGVRSLEVGDPVRICRMFSPLRGRTGKIVAVTEGDPYGPYLVQFDEGLRFRYRRKELAALTNTFDSAKDHR